MTVPIFSIVLIGIGVLVALVGGIMLLVAAFRQSVLWGLIVLFAPAGNIIYTCVHWAEAKAGFLLSLAGTVVCIGGICTLPEFGKAFAQARNGQLAGFPGSVPEQKPAAPDLTAQIAEKRARIEELQRAFAAQGSELPALYQQLEKRRKALKAGDAEAVAKFNEDAAAYQARNRQHKEIAQQMAATQNELDQLLEARSQARAAGQPAAGKKVVMYTTSSCPACVTAKQYFAKKGVPYEEIDVERSMEGRQAFQKLGGRGVPLIMVGDKRMEGFSEQALDAAL